MPGSRVIYQNWIVELGLDPLKIKNFFDIIETSSEKSAEIDRQVRAAMESLSEDEMEFVIRFYFMGQGYNEISAKSGRANHKLEALHKRAIRKLKNRLQPFVKKSFGIKLKKGRACLICDSPERAKIDRIILKKKAEETWSPVMKRIFDQFGIKIKSPQTLIGHRKYH
ncbi:MAG: sigma-70 family RNA polymerase sigma factor [candidate division Zixibacteria bacterium]|nr:sigma-70 family RNA polymerase sigma factor [candidate division Zixibacteria bacterium]